MIDKLVLTVTPIFSIPPRGAAAVETWMYQVAQRTKIQNRIACIKNEGYSDFLKVNDHCSVHRIGFSRLYKRLFQKWTRLDPLPYSQRILNIAKDFNVTDDSVIIVHNSIKLYRQIRKRAPKAKMVMHMHNAFEPDGLDQNVKMIVLSLFLKKHYQTYLPDADIAIVPNGIDLEAYQKNTVPLQKSDLGITQEKKTIFFAGRISPDKGVTLLLQAFEQLLKERNDIELVVVGDYMSKSKGNKAAYQREVRELAERLKPHCRMVGGVTPEEIYNYYSLADLVVIPSQFQEPFCMVAIETMGAGKPVLVSTRGGMTEFVKEGDTGFYLQEPMTPETIARDINKALASPDLNDVALRGQRCVEEKFPWEKVTQRFEKVVNNWFK
ncbi:TPA: lipopolysaccharide N-acetylglucosaminyltransferase [Salmonella enterica subsp. enterica serovar Vietnam]|uniref:Lipopolysaccharide N-acetylglucosaminyltransferase n=1 Tax=Salmonella enterica subsp. arizonae TaxID=59203 RepID=A0A5Y2QR29_SALER|nr:lipopolysaccharide N-acetylglucosaminyltransferase [Salmonella enterica]ECF4924441.1 lipopolysaccharide N-acetylglucosaminyltransferase [Salmonella enterica subsp. arizonae]ECI9863058.1 lipopolysaccharide N-acetylglucosaminyltransferase [Salmonella enterica subsp. arizonae]HAE8194796.1 lipopolysaccharide N-acetylglucosaminyltransferase [Salmonella enterica subsp. indica serovar 41:b:1,7]HAU3218942.1 lipopolysaccharide N-acetylglucosaminyltransferase [Salmonella enterica subsp. indica]